MSRQFPDRRGFTLLELMVAVTLSSLLLMTGVMLFAALINAQRDFSFRERQRRELSRLDAILRSDSHAAATAIVAGGEQCELRSVAGETWSYRREEDNLLRVWTKAGNVVQRESFRLPPGTKLEFQVNRAGQRTWLAVNLLPPTKAGTPWHARFLVGGLVAERAEESP